MACYHPLLGAVVGRTAKGKQEIKILGAMSDDYCQAYTNGKTVIGGDSAKFHNWSSSWYPIQTVTIPCGQCIGCRLQYSRDWATRLMLENLDHDSSFFITLTYDDDHVPYSNKPQLDELNKTTYYNKTLAPDDLTKFWKRLRKHFPDCKIRYYACGEYGDNTMRPHYHAIVYGLKFPPGDLKYLKTSPLGHDYFTSATLDKLWKYGFNMVAGVSWQSCAYVSRYVVKKLKGKMSDEYEKNGIVPPFVRMSNKPGIAANYYDVNKNVFLENKGIQMPDGNFAPLPRSFLKKLADDKPDEYNIYMKERSRLARSSFESNLEKYEYKFFEQLELREHAHELGSKKLERRIE